MKIAIAINDGRCSQHFGHCEGYEVFEVENNNIENKEFLDSPPHTPGLLPKFLHENGVNVIIAGGMGQRAQDLFAQNNIEVIVGAEGDANELIKKFIESKLVSDKSICTNHENEEDC